MSSAGRIRGCDGAGSTGVCRTGVHWGIRMADKPAPFARQLDQPYTVVGFLDAGSASVTTYLAPHWANAAQLALRSYPDLQPAAVLAGEQRPIGVWENLPEQPPAFGLGLGSSTRKFSLIGFNIAGSEERLDACEAVGWVNAAFMAMREYGSTYRFIAAFDGLVQVMGTWSMLRDAVASTSGETADAGSALTGAPRLDTQSPAPSPAGTEAIQS